MRVGTLIRRPCHMVEPDLNAEVVRRRIPADGWLAAVDDCRVLGFVRAGDLPLSADLAIRSLVAKYPEVREDDQVETVLELMQEQGWEAVEVRGMSGLVGVATQADLARFVSEHSEQVMQEIDRHAARLTQMVDDLRKEIVSRHRVERLLRIQNELSFDLSGAEDIPAVLRHLLNAVLELDGVDAAAVYIVEPTTGAPELQCAEGLSADFLARHSRFSADSETTRQLMEGHPIYTAVHKSPLAESLAREGFCSVAVLPIWCANQVVGGLGLTSRSQLEIPATQRQTIESMVDRVGMAMVRLRGQERLRQARDELEQRVAARTAELTQLNEALWQEIEERRQAEAALRLSREEFANLLQSLDHVVWAADPVTNEIIYVNDSVARLYGRPRQEFVDDTELWFKVIHPDDQPKVRACGQALLATGRQDYEYRILRPDGEIRWVRDWVRVERDAAGSPVRLTGIVSDVTELKRAEEAARQQQMDLAHVSRLATMGELAAGIAHEVNQPLTSIVNFSRGCMRRIRSGGDQPGQVLEILEQVALQAERAGDIIRGLRRFLRKQETQRAMVDLAVVIRDALALCEGEARKNRVPISVCLPKGLPGIWADAIQIEQVVLNLIWNGIEAMRSLDPEGRRLTIAAAVDADGQVLVTVQDSGLGMPREMLVRAFEPFYTTKPSAMGLGLAISKSIIEAHGGRIWLSSDARCGTIVSFTLPRTGTGERHV